MKSLYLSIWFHPNQLPCCCPAEACKYFPELILNGMCLSPIISYQTFLIDFFYNVAFEVFSDLLKFFGCIIV